jgi:hypothetical protein
LQNADRFAAALERLAADRELAARLISAGLQTASRFTARGFHETLEQKLRRTAAETKAIRGA